MEEVNVILKNAGFFKERNIDITLFLKMYDKNGYLYYKHQTDFLKRYGNLEIHYKHPVWQEDMIIRINPLEAQKVISMEVVEGYNTFLEDKLLIIGDIEKENITLFLSKNGVFYGGYDDCIINWGDNFENMLFNIFKGRRGELQVMD